RTAEQIKIEVGSAFPLEERITMEIKGRHLIEGVPKTITITDEEIREALAETVNVIVDAVRVALERTPPELSADIVDRGIVRTGVPVLESVTFGIFSEVQRGLTSGLSGIREVWSGYVGLRNLKAENDELKRQLAAIQVAAQEQRALADRAAGFEKLLELRER